MGMLYVQGKDGTAWFLPDDVVDEVRDLTAAREAQILFPSLYDPIYPLPMLKFVAHQTRLIHTLAMGFLLGSKEEQERIGKAIEILKSLLEKPTGSTEQQEAK